MFSHHLNKILDTLFVLGESQRRAVGEGMCMCLGEQKALRREHREAPGRKAVQTSLGVKLKLCCRYLKKKKKLLRVTSALLHLILGCKKELLSPKGEWALGFLQNPAPSFCCAQMLLGKVKLCRAAQERERFRDLKLTGFLTIPLPG